MNVRSTDTPVVAQAADLNVADRDRVERTRFAVRSCRSPTRHVPIEAERARTGLTARHCEKRPHRRGGVGRVAPT